MSVEPELETQQTRLEKIEAAQAEHERWHGNTGTGPVPIQRGRRR